ncbi:hypothetical protein N431DRAFT_83297 [Stipitochalara longipes BDJ]|nr:hypothetical protein N431DRAFT_83297 [Stipitochalara longipes BDJ]
MQYIIFVKPSFTPTPMPDPPNNTTPPPKFLTPFLSQLFPKAVPIQIHPKIPNQPILCPSNLNRNACTHPHHRKYNHHNNHDNLPPKLRLLPAANPAMAIIIHLPIISTRKLVSY